MTNQSVSDSENGNIIQVGRDYNKYGLDFAEVERLFQLLLTENFPRLREEARNEARKNIDDFFQEKIIPEIERRLQQKESLQFESLISPDVQCSINDAVMGAARRGEAANTDILSILLVERMCSDSNDYLSLVAAEAIKVIPRLTREQIGFLTLVWFFNNTSINTASSLNDLMPLASQILASSESSFGISESQRHFLAYTGCVSILNLVSNTPYLIWKNTYSFLKNTTEDELKSDINQHFHVLKALADAYEKTKVYEVTLSPIGQMIAASNYSRINSVAINYSEWIN